MSKATDMAKVSAKGGFHLLWGLVASTIISSVGTIIIARLLGSDNMGLYALAVAAPNLIATFRDWGVSTAMVRYTAQYNSENDVAKIRSVFISGFTFEIIVGLALAVLSISISGLLADAFQRPAIAQLIQITSVFILVGGLVNTATAAFTGLEKMHFNSIMLIIQSIIKTGLIIGLVVLGLGTLGATIGFAVAVLIAGVTGVLLTYMMYSGLPKPTSQGLGIVSTMKTLLKYGLPLSIGSILNGFLVQFYSWVMAYFVTDNSAIGNYSVATTFIVLISFVATPVITVLLPAFSKLDYRKDHKDLQNIFQYSVKYATLLVLPVTTLVMSLAGPAVNILFGESYPTAPLFLALLSLIYIFTAFGNLSVANLINSQGDTKFVMYVTALTVVIGFPLSFILISQFGIIGLIVNSTVVVVPGLIWSINFIKRRYNITLDWISSLKIVFCAATTGTLTYLFVTWLPFNSIIRLILGLAEFVAVFLLLAIPTRVLNDTDLNNIRQMAAGLGPIGKILGVILKLFEKFTPKQK